MPAGDVTNKLTDVLLRLADVLDCPYDHLMELAGYVAAAKLQSKSKITFLEAALRNEQLSEEEQRAVLAFISFLKANRPKS